MINVVSFQVGCCQTHERTLPHYCWRTSPRDESSSLPERGVQRMVVITNRVQLPHVSFTCLKTQNIRMNINTNMAVVSAHSVTFQALHLSQFSRSSIHTHVDSGLTSCLIQLRPPAFSSSVFLFFLCHSCATSSLALAA